MAKKWLLRCAVILIIAMLSMIVMLTHLNIASAMASAAPTSSPSALVIFLFDNKLFISLTLFALLTINTAFLFYLDRSFRLRVQQKLNPLSESAVLTSTNKPLLRQIMLVRLAFVLLLGGLFLFLLYTYQSYSDQVIVKWFAIGIFALNMSGVYWLGSLKRARQMEKLINKLQAHVKNKELAQQKLLLAEKRLQSQSSSLASLAAMQLNKQTLPKVFFRQLVRQAAETLEIRRVSVWLYSKDKQLLECEALYDLDTKLYTHGDIIHASEMPMYFAALSRERVIVVNDAYKDAVTQEFVEDYLPKHQVGAMLDATIWQDDEIIGVICHEHVGGVRQWTLDEQNYVGSLADLARLTLELQKRQKVETDLVEHQENLETLVQHRTAIIENNAKLFRFLVERAPVTILYMNAANEILEMNPEAERVGGYPREYAIGRTYQSLFVPEGYSEQHTQYASEVAYGNKLQGKEMLIRRADGSTIELAVSRSMELDAEGNPVIISIGQDITQQKALEASLIQAREAAESADRIKSMFVASMSHELRTPLNSIIGFLGVVLQGMSGELNPKQKDQLGRAYASSKHLLSLISDVIDISKIEAGFLEAHPVDIDLAHLLDDVAHAVDHLVHEKKLQFTIDCPSTLVIESDRKRLYQVILNVVSNGLKYTEKGDVRVTVQCDEESVTIEVTDSGIGIDAAGIEKLFKPFERIDSRLKIKTLGTGLGLYLTHKILTMLLGGEIKVKSQLEVGSTFTISLPYKMPKLDQTKTVNILEPK